MNELVDIASKNVEFNEFMLVLKQKSEYNVDTEEKDASHGEGDHITTAEMSEMSQEERERTDKEHLATAESYVQDAVYAAVCILHDTQHHNIETQVNVI